MAADRDLRSAVRGRLAGKHALITGGTSGIGLATAREFLAEGATVAITGRSPDKLAEAARQLEGPLLPILSDAGDVPGQAALAARLRAEWPKLDILMSNAADVTHLPIEEWTEEAFDRLLATNLKSPFFLIKHLLPLFSRRASVVLVGSVSAFVGHEGATVYGAAKAGLLSYARGLTYELTDRGIRVNGLSPGPTVTNALSALGAERQAAVYEELRRTVPLHRLGSATELAKAAVYLASDESAYTAGTVLRVDGGIGELAY
ncbi:SDR family oxidoreductase [Amycolatopsis endophytica]|uniref:NAD(P)-dependent dehydrogenase (Short-subunit alcohol dehydrogenase family) n=1 Tax=Amycolatopsis endophytica TaxID=860233 RepID=A0A853BAH1_9PSEU|nr:SDR family oxidoreductase [Amycolatopsis endophytica]NYI91990.1 NAD(P)-dependent dehydrogenase (short-subunit alcohol dehydrogenase family) [Amycolatopsis endophytica]